MDYYIFVSIIHFDVLPQQRRQDSKVYDSFVKRDIVSWYHRANIVRLKEAVIYGFL